jgi:hypothetical protein
MGLQPRRVIVIARRDGTAGLSVITPPGAIEPLPDGVQTDEEIKRVFNADEVVWAPNIGFGAAVCVDGPQAGQRTYAARSLTGAVLIAGSTYAVADPEGDPIPLRFTGE